MSDDEIKVQLEEHELEYLKKLHNARALHELTQQPGWEIYTKVIADMVARFEDQHLNFAIGASRDAYWISGVRLAAIREFAKILQEQIAQTVDLLKQPLTPPKPRNAADYDGDYRNGLAPEGDE